MIDLKRNSKKIPVKATGLRVKKKSIYTPNQREDFKISRGKFSNFLSCQKCFYLDRVKGLDAPGTPAWTLNETTDLLLKKEFDKCREIQKPHRIFLEHNLNHLVPFKHPEIDKWRDSLHAGLMLRYKHSNIILTGGVDDIWQNTLTEELIIVDYKSQAKQGIINTKEYLNDPFHEGYKIQMDFYAYLLEGMGFNVSPISYFLVCNADRSRGDFQKAMHFEEYLIPYTWNNSWIEKKIDLMLEIINNNQIPKANECCKNCAYSYQFSRLHKAGLD
tara:strand:+ start:189 stop:1010 length:822 start_codon:yes stop_codon:yes gene_type:complete